MRDSRKENLQKESCFAEAGAGYCDITHTKYDDMSDTPCFFLIDKNGDGEIDLRIDVRRNVVELRIGSSWVVPIVKEGVYYLEGKTDSPQRLTFIDGKWRVAQGPIPK